MRKVLLTSSTILLSCAGSLALASPYPTVAGQDLDEERVYSPYAGRAYPDQVLFGDTHLHTSLSPDAGLVGTTLAEKLSGEEKKLVQQLAKFGGKQKNVAQHNSAAIRLQSPGGSQAFGQGFFN